MKTFELILGIILIVASVVLVTYWSRGSLFRDEEWHPFQIGFVRNPIGTIIEIVIALGLLAGGGFMLWLWSR
jgi:hypothetical protein